MIKSICSRHDCDEPNENKTKTQQFVKDKQEMFSFISCRRHLFSNGFFEFCRKQSPLLGATDLEMFEKSYFPGAWEN